VSPGVRSQGDFQTVDTHANQGLQVSGHVQFAGVLPIARRRYRPTAECVRYRRVATGAAGTQKTGRLYFFDVMEPLNNSVRSAFQSEKPQIVWCDPSDSSRRYGRGMQRSRCGFSGETHMGRAFPGDPLRFGSLIWNNQTTLAEATASHPGKTPSRPHRVFQRLLIRVIRAVFESTRVGASLSG
jgi:hypothetical protein